MSGKNLLRYGWMLMWLAPVVLSDAVRSLTPIDETRYLSVAWEMWVRGDFLVPHLNGSPYSDKPPLLFWLYHLGWWSFGINDWWPRLAAPSFALGSLFMTAALARRLWPGRERIKTLAPWVLGGTFYWVLYTPAAMPDMILTAFVLVGLFGLWSAGHESFRGGWLIFGLACGLGILTKGPVALLHLGVPAAFGPWWSERARRRPLAWYAGFTAAVVTGALIALAWAVPAAERGGPTYAQAIFWQQTADRMVKSFAHERPWWWYSAILPVMLFPWVLWPPLYRAAAEVRRSLDDGSRFCFSCAVPTFVAFSLISGKQPHYLLPLFPAFALLAARALDASGRLERRVSRLLPAAALAVTGVALMLIPFVHLGALPHWTRELHPLWGAVLVGLALWLLARPASRLADTAVSLGVAAALSVVVTVTGFFQAAGAAFDVTAAAHFLADLERKDIPVAHLGKYHGQFEFLGRLKRPLQIVKPEELAGWAQAHQGGTVILYDDSPVLPTGPQPWFAQPYRTGWLAIWPVGALCRYPACNPSSRDGAARASGSE